MSNWPHTGLPRQLGKCTEEELTAVIDAKAAIPHQARGVASIERSPFLAAVAMCTADACKQGRKPCPVPHACLRPEPPRPGRHVPSHEARANRLRGLRGVVAVLGVPAAVVLLIGALDALMRLVAPLLP
jgi:hypothetical protein